MWDISRTLHITGKRWRQSAVLVWLLALLAKFFPKVGCVRFELLSWTAVGSILQTLYLKSQFHTANSLRLEFIPPRCCNSRLRGKSGFNQPLLDFVEFRLLQLWSECEWVLHCHSTGKLRKLRREKMSKNSSTTVMIAKDLHPTKK